MILTLLRTLGRAITRMRWGLADQSLSSFTNFALGVTVARILSPAEFGAFSIAFGVYTIALGASRAFTSEPLLVRFSAVQGVGWTGGVRAATGTTMWVALLAGMACIGSGLVTDGALASSLIALGLTMPGLLLQDGWRFAFFSAGRGSAAFVNDLIWGIVLMCSIAFLLLRGGASVFGLVLAWGASASLAALVGIFQARFVPAFGHAGAWVHAQRDLIPRYTAEFGLTTFVAQLTVIGIGAFAGLAQAGAIRAAALLLGPLNVVYLGVSLAGLPEGVRALRVSKAKLARACRWWSASLAVSALGVGALASVLPDRFGRLVLGANWGLAEDVVVPLSISMAASGVIMGAGIGLRALAAADLSLRARLLVAPLVLAASLGGAARSGARGAAWGFAFAYGVGSFIWWRFFATGLRRHTDGRAGSADAPMEPMEPDIPEVGFHA